MKRLAILPILTFVMWSCSSVSHIPAQENVIAFDFSDYTEQGFMITPEDYSGPYESIGLINMTISPEARKVPRSDNPRSSEDDYVPTQWIVNRITTDELVGAAYEQAKQMGADAIINFSVTSHSRSPVRGLTIPEYTVSGFAIRRLDQ